MAYSAGVPNKCVGGVIAIQSIIVLFQILKCVGQKISKIVVKMFRKILVIGGDKFSNF